MFPLCTLTHWAPCVLPFNPPLFFSFLVLLTYYLHFKFNGNCIFNFSFLYLETDIFFIVSLSRNPFNGNCTFNFSFLSLETNMFFIVSLSKNPGNFYGSLLEL